MGDEMAFVVVEGAYDYEPIQVFSGEGAQAAADQLAFNCGDGATVKALPMRSADWVPSTWVRMESNIGIRSGNVIGERSRDARTDFSGASTGKAHSEARLRSGRWVVTTTGDGACVPAAHAAAVGAKRAEILGEGGAQ